MKAEINGREKPHEQKVDYNIDDHLIVGHQKKWKRVIELILTLLAWILMLSYLVYEIYGDMAIDHGWYLPEFVVYNRAMIEETRLYYIFLLIAFLLAFVILIIWKNYNRVRFGKLHRREFLPEVTDEELVKKFEITPEQLKQFREERNIVLEHNIIPKDLGMGYKNNK
ncbi:MAG: poly-beta-1,6-N-acetyl-D-glucosamine biosynthesis protein PgaD [Eubacterium sp.]|nr:poly-beta-1,6-N-acetyl-D-glucosamine biosynthesis protein PgaD [Eubacterium sp.]